jgi:hypothetical protein
MKKLFLLALLSLQLCVMAQTTETKLRKINAHYSWSTVGANVSVAYQFKFKKIEPFAGIMYHINMPVNDLRFHAFRHRFHHYNFMDGLGINFGLTRPFALKNSNIGLHFLYISQVSRMHNRFLTLYYDPNSFSPSLREHISSRQMLIVENNIGLGINVKAYGNFYLNASAAYGMAVYMAKNNFSNNKLYRQWELSDHYRIGVSYLIPSGS